MPENSDAPNDPNTSDSDSPPAAPPEGSEIGELASMYLEAADALTDALREACDRTSVRRVARWSGLSIGLLSNLVTGKRRHLSPDLAQRVAALRRPLPIRPDEQAECEQWQQCDQCGMEVRRDRLHAVEDRTRLVTMNICVRCLRDQRES